MNLFTTSFDDVVNYDDFLKVLYKFGDIPFQQPPQIHGASFNSNYMTGGMGQDYSPLQQQMHSLNLNQDGMLSSKPQDLAAGSELMHKMRESFVQKLKPQQLEVVSRLRAQLHGQGLEDVLRRFARDNKDRISEDDLLIGISKLNANIHLGDIKELTNILKKEGKDEKVSIAETVQLIAQ